MNRGIPPERVFLAWALVCLAGCASTRNEAPPEVVDQPQEITANQAVAEGLDAELQAATDTTAAAVSQAAARERAQRRRPTERSTEEVRRLASEAPHPLDFQQRLDHAHDRTYSWMQGRVEATDQRFADKDTPFKPTPAAPFRIGMMLESIDRSDGMEFNFNANFDITLDLPNIEERLGIFITSDDLDEAPDTARDDGSLRAGLRYQVFRHLDFDLGIRVDVPPVAFASLKWTHEYELGNWDFYPLAKLFVETRESFGYALGTTFDRWSGRHLFRSSTYAKWRHDRNQTEWSQSLVYARAHELIVPNRYGSYPRANDIGRGWGVRVLASGEDTNVVSHYEAGTFYSRPAANGWLFWSVEPLVRWDRQYNWNADPGIRLGFNALFWDLARPAR